MNKDKLYISTIAYDAYAVAHKYGLGIEIAEFCTAWNMDDEFDETDKKLKRNIDGINRRILHAPFNELFPCAIDRKARKLAEDRYRQAIALANDYRATKVIIHGGYNPCLYYPQWYVEQSILFWKKFLKELSLTCYIALENTFEQTPDVLLDIIKGVNDSRLKLCLDIGHINAYSKIPVTDWIEYCRGFISHFHVHNNDGLYDSHSPLEQGSIPLNSILELAEKLCPDASYTLELMEAEASVMRIVNL